MPNDTTLTRIEKVLDYIHEHLDEPICVAALAEKSCWSRWQFQRVFGSATGLTVAQYVRELRLSQAAELLLGNQDRHLDIALACGFESDISFSRAFKQMFRCSPREYRQRGKRIGLRTPLKHCTPKRTWSTPTAFTQIRIENRAAFSIAGCCDWICGPFSEQPNFIERVPQVWRALEQERMCSSISPKDSPIGVIDNRKQNEHPDRLLYWAGYPACGSYPSSCGSYPATKVLNIPEQEYAVIPVHGMVSALESAVEWFIGHWLPDSNYSGASGFELEVYSPNYNPISNDSYMEYWLPIEPR